MKKIGNLNPYALDYPVCLSQQQLRMREFLRDDIENTSDSIQYEPCEDVYSSNYLNKMEVKVMN